MPTNGKRIAYGRNQNRVSLSTYPDDTSVPVRTSHWNQDPHDQAILGFTKITATLDASGVIYTKDDSSTTLEDDGNTYSRQSTLIEVECEGVTTTDAIVKIDVTDTNENDILYLFKGTASDAITIASGTPSVAGHIKTQLSGGATLVHDGVPIMLIRRGDYWYEFGADGAASTFTAISSDTLENKTINTSDNTITVASADVTGLSTSLADKAPIAAPTFTGDVTTASSVLKNQGIAGMSGVTITTPTSNSIGHVVVAPSGTGTRGQITTSNSSDPSTNGELLAIGSDIYVTNEHAIRTQATGSGTVRPLAVYFDTTKVMQITDANGIDINGNNIDNVQNVIHDISATGLDIDFSEDQLQTYPTLTGNVTFTTFQNIVAGKSKTIRLLADGSDRTCTFPSGIKWVGTAPTSNVHTVTASKYAIITFTSFGTTEAEIIGAFALQE